MNPPETKRTYQFLTAFFITLAVFLSVLFFAMYKAQKSLLWFIESSYLPNHNIIPSVKIGDWTIHHYYYLIFLITISLLTIIHIIVQYKNSRQNLSQSLIQITIKAAFSLTFIIIFIQFIGMKNVFINEFMFFAKKSMHEKHKQIGKISYDYAVIVKKIFPGHHNAELITDMDMDNDPGMFMHRQLSYYLYPIDIRNVRNGQKNLAVLFLKNNLEENTPPEYQLIEKFNNSLGVGIRKSNYE